MNLLYLGGNKNILDISNISRVASSLTLKIQHRLAVEFSTIVNHKPPPLSVEIRVRACSSHVLALLL